MSAKNLIFGIMAGFTTGTILGIMLTSSRSVAMRKKILTQGEAYLDETVKKLNDHLRDFTNRFDRKIEKQTHEDKRETAST